MKSLANLYFIMTFFESKNLDQLRLRRFMVEPRGLGVKGSGFSSYVDAALNPEAIYNSKSCTLTLVLPFEAPSAVEGSGFWA